MVIMAFHLCNLSISQAVNSAQVEIFPSQFLEQIEFRSSLGVGYKFRSC
jgi:hypothetical protein